MAAYYNEIDPYAAEWLRTLILLGHIADGVVDTRSISDVEPYDLKDFTQCHFFAGIGVWSHALRIAGWPDERPVWTGSCPCQPFSSAGRSGGFADERHLWPHFHHLIRECRPGVVFGEQVASKDGLAWLDLVHTDMEGEGYAFSAVDLCAAGVGAPHIRQRLYWVADADHQRRTGQQVLLRAEEAGRDSSGVLEVTRGGCADRVADANNAGLEGHGWGHQAQGWGPGSVRPVAQAGEPCGVADATGERLEEQVVQRGHGADELQEELLPDAGAVSGSGQPATRPTNGHWRDADRLYCRDGKWRPVEPGTFPLAHGAAARVGRLRAYGNAIVPQVAAQVIGSYMDVYN